MDEYQAVITARNYPTVTRVADTADDALARAQQVVARWNRERTPGTRPVVADVTMQRRQVTPWEDVDTYETDGS